MKEEEIREGDIVEIDYIERFTKEHINEGKALVIWKGFNSQPLVRKLGTKTTVWSCYNDITRVIGHIDIERYMDNVLAEENEKDRLQLISVKQNPCDDAITRILKRMWNCRGKHTTSIDKVKMEQIICDELPSVNLQEPKTGHWIKKEYWEPLPYDTEPLDYDNYNEKTHSEKVYHYYCSECGRDNGEIKPTDNYCPDCGARMVEPQERRE